MQEIIQAWIPRAPEILGSREFTEWRRAVHPELLQARVQDVHVLILEYLSWRIDQELIEAGLIKPPNHYEIKRHEQ